ncbi:MAG: 4-alpha-glucanotransferase [Ilumatobacteraceae bacterium]
MPRCSRRHRRSTGDRHRTVPVPILRGPAAPDLAARAGADRHARRRGAPVRRLARHDGRADLADPALTYLGSEDSPYFSPSSFAGNTWLIDLGELVDVGLLDGFEPPSHRDDSIDFESMRAWKAPLLETAAAAFLDDDGHPWWPEYERFVAGAQWLGDVCHFIARKDADPDAMVGVGAGGCGAATRTLAASAIEHAGGIEREQVWQFFFDRQWRAVRERANAAGIVVLGDTPIYVAPDSADVWAHQDQFQLDDDGRLTAQAGVPPDYFSETGQLWGNPIYRWDAMADDGAAGGSPVSADPRTDRHRPHRSLPCAVRALVECPPTTRPPSTARGCPVPASRSSTPSGQFPQLPSSPKTSAISTTTCSHYATTTGWWGCGCCSSGSTGRRTNTTRVGSSNAASCTPAPTTTTPSPDGGPRRPAAARNARRDTAMPPRVGTRRVWWLIETTMATPAVAAVVPMQDVLVLGADARMNIPGTAAGNWRWRLDPVTSPSPSPPPSEPSRPPPTADPGQPPTRDLGGSLANRHQPPRTRSPRPDPRSRRLWLRIAHRAPPRTRAFRGKCSLEPKFVVAGRRGSMAR